MPTYYPGDGGGGSNTSEVAQIVALASQVAAKADVTAVNAETARATAAEAARALDAAVLHLAGAEAVAGVKTFSAPPVVPVGAFPETAVANLVADLAGKQATIMAGTYAPGRFRGNRFISLGDSVTIGDGSPTANLVTPAARDYLRWAEWYSDQRIVHYRNAGIAGNHTADMLARMQADVIAYKPTVCVVIAGTNDCYFSDPFATSTANISAIIANLKAAHIQPVIGTIPPITNQGAAFEQRVERWNEWVRHFAAAEHVPLVDMYSVLVDTATDWYLATTAQDASLHPSNYGTMLMGQALAQVLSPFLQGAQTSLRQAGGSTNSVVDGGLFLTNAAGVGTGWVSTGGVASIVADPTIKGNWQRLTLPANTGDQFIFQDGAAVAVGDVIRVSGLIQWSLPAGSYPATGHGADVRIQSGAGGSFGWAMPLQTGANFTSAPVDLSAGPHAFEVEWTVPAGQAGAMRLMIWRAASGATAGGWVQVAQLSALNLTALGLPSRLTGYGAGTLDAA